MDRGTTIETMWVLIGRPVERLDSDAPTFASPEGQPTALKEHAALFHTEIEAAEFRDTNPQVHLYNPVRYGEC